MTDVTEIVDGNSTDIHANFAGCNWFEFLFLSCECVIYL
ncbi:hypothetical protein THZG08_50206 [Vibrio owensii]|uniref:Uncharacterized protein n=1 Tax=Vibrio owensii TaxID=696485 RepID=A0AAU9PY71_9VIBR|nr:hypothetical protein THF1D04_10284 [Vibrio owensii]CAH1535347.1 hypothetical protein THZG08_50206 [Vibrio owensii]CAH1577664.1 hypothetical protein THZB04_30282 [Vibrio owensii]